MREALARSLQRAWWRPQRGALALVLSPLAALTAWVAGRRRRRHDGGAVVVPPLPVPVIVVGNVIVGGAGKTPTVIALVALLRAWGLTPGIVSRGYGRSAEVPALIDAAPATATTAREVGDEPLLMHRRTGAPVAIGRARREAAEHLLAAHPEVDVIVADDGLQHHALPRDIEIVVFDGRGVGNGLTLPAGPLREPVHALWPEAPVPIGHARADANADAAAAMPPTSAPARLVLLNGPWPAAPARALPAPAARTWPAQRALAGAVALAAWASGDRAPSGDAAGARAALDALRQRPLVAVAGIGEPERFFTMLEAAGLRITRLPQPDHARFEALPWPAGTPDVVVTEKDAVKLAGRPLGSTRVWVVPLDFAFDPGFVAALREALDATLARRAAGARLATPDAASRHAG
jgi:tetraacyldisaccharide 4'-kinase